MVGLKTFWIICALLIVGACVPQTKQTSCKKNEAFNSQIRACVPIVGDVDTFVIIDDYTPQNTLSKSKSDTSDVEFSITVSNPYNHKYTIQWQVIYNGTPMDPMNYTSTNVPSITLVPSDYANAYGIGIYLIKAKVLVGSKIADTQNFELKINALPTPTIDTTLSVPQPDLYTYSFTPIDGPQDFGFTIRNNIGLDVTHQYKTTWTVTKNGAAYPRLNGDVDLFTNFGALDTNETRLGFGPTRFDPSIDGIGNYVFRATVSNGTTGEVFEERNFYVSVVHPDIGRVMAANLPLTSVDSIAFHSVSYNLAGFFDSTQTKSNFCVRVSKPEGAYTDGSASDPTSNTVAVRFYKDNGVTPIYEGYTTSAPLKDTVCFSEAGAPVQQQLFYSDGSTTIPHYKNLIARVFDVQTGLEHCVDGRTCSVTYPVNWKILVKPKNTPIAAIIRPSIGGDNVTYSATPGSTTTTSTITVAQDTNFKVRFRLTDGQFEYDPATNLDKFKYTATLKQGSTIVNYGTCAKDFTDTNGALNAAPQDNVGPEYECQFNIPSSDVSGPLAPLAHTLTIQAEDADSPVTELVDGAGNGGVLSNLLTWNIAVTEAQTAPSIALTNILVGGAPVASATEGQTITFQFAISDFEKDNYTLQVFKCTTAACTVLNNFTNNTVTPVTYGLATYLNNVSISYTIPEDEIGNVASGNIYFRARVTDIPTNPLLGISTTLTPDITVPVNNYNPPPVINNLALTAPAVGNVTAYNVTSSYRFSISTAGAVSDASAVTSENTLRYKWWIKPAASATWTAIDGAESSDGTLKWTPGPELTADQHIRVCVSDNAYNRPISADPSVAGTICSNDYLITPKPNLEILPNFSGGLNGKVAVHHVPGERIAYVAYASNTQVHVEKFVYNLDGTLNTSGMRVATFNATTLGANGIKNLSITATANNVYVAYLAADAGNPGNYKPRIRKINIENATQGTKSDTIFAASTRKFDFNNLALVVSATCTAPNCIVSSTPTVNTVTFNGDVMNPGVDGISVQGVLFTADAGIPTPSDKICSLCTPASQAASLANAINTSINLDLQGVTAVSSGPTVTIYGLEGANLYDSPNVAIGMGKIVTDGTTWFLPFINSSAGGSDQNKIEILSQADSDPLTSLTVGTTLSTLDRVSDVDNGLSSTGTLVLGYTTLTGSIAKVVNLDAAFAPVGTPLTIFSGVAINNIKIKPSPGASNPNVFVVAQDNTNAFRLARLPINLGAAGRQVTALSIADSVYPTNSMILGGTIIDMDIQPSAPQSPAITTNEARVVVLSNAGGATYQSYLFRWREIASSPYEALDCAEGLSLERTGTSVASHSKIATFPISSVTIGDSGSTVTDKTNAAMAFIKVNATDEAEFGIVNTEIETIHSINRDATGFYRPALVR